MKKVIWLVLCGALLGVVGLITFDGVIHATSTDEFCTSCHEMDKPYQNLQYTAHYKNEFGMVAHCSDCHVPKEFIPKMVRKVEAAREVWGTITGIIDTPEKYAAHRDFMREREIKRMRNNDSQECRNCHIVEQMDFEHQDRSVRRYHRGMEQRGKTCIDCHQGLAHSDPKDEVKEDD